MSPTLSHTGTDPIDRLLTWTGGEVLKVGHDVTGGEYDAYLDGAVSTRTRRRLAAAGLVSSHGLEADRLAHVVAPYAPGVATMNADEFVAWYVAECIAGLDMRAAARMGATWAEQVCPEPEPECEPEPERAERSELGGPVPEWAIAWLVRTVHAPKADYLGALISWRYLGDAEPECPNADWARKCRAKFDARARKSERVRRSGAQV